MAGKPNAAFVRAVDKAGKYGDGQLGSMLLVHPGGRKQFVQRVTIRGRRCDLGLGSYPMATLARDRDQTSGESLPSDKGCDPRARPAPHDSVAGGGTYFPLREMVLRAR